MKIALTGGLATGKSEALRLLAERLTSYKVVAYEDLLRCLFRMPEFLAQAHRMTGARSFEELRPLLLRDERTRYWFNGFVDSWLDNQLEQLLGEHSRIVVEMPRLLETARHLERFDYVVSTVVDRLEQHDALARLTGLPPSNLDALMHSEYSAELRSVCCDFALFTHGTEPSLPRQIDQLVADVHRVSLRTRAEKFFGTEHVWELLERRLERLDPRLRVTSLLGSLFEVFSRHQGLALNARSVELALWFAFSGPATLNLSNAAAWAGQSVRDMWACLRQHCPGLLNQGETVALAAQMLLSMRLGHPGGVDTISRSHWQRDVGLFLDLVNAHFAQMSGAELLAYARDVEQVMAGVMAPGESFCAEAFGRWYQLEGPFHHPEMARAYAARLLRLRARVEEEILEPCAQRQAPDLSGTSVRSLRG